MRDYPREAEYRRDYTREAESRRNYPREAESYRRDDRSVLIFLLASCSVIGLLRAGLASRQRSFLPA